MAIKKVFLYICGGIIVSHFGFTFVQGQYQVCSEIMCLFIKKNI